MLSPRRLLCALALLAVAPALAQDVPFESSNLPIVLIDTDGQAVPDEPKVTAQMRVDRQRAGPCGTR